MKTQDKIKQAVEGKLAAMLKKGAKKPDKEDLQVLNMAIKYLAVSAKLDESEWGSGLEDLENDTDDDVKNPDGAVS